MEHPYGQKVLPRINRVALVLLVSLISMTFFPLCIGGPSIIQPRTSPVSDLVAIPQDNSITLTWSSPYETDDSDFNSYRVYKDDNNAILTVSGMTPIATINDNSETEYSVNGLVNMHTYYFAVTAVNSSMVESGTIATSGTPKEWIAPAISDISTINITYDNATITWTTDEPSTTRLKYGTTTSYSMVSGDDQLVISHTVVLNGLASVTKYYFAVNSTDMCENSNESGPFNFSTTTVDTQPPVISDVVIQTYEHEVIISWTTNEPATSMLMYGRSWPNENTISNGSFTLFHSITIDGLNPNLGFQYIIRSEDQSGNVAQTAESSFFTDPPGSDMGRVKGYVRDHADETGMSGLSVYLFKPEDFNRMEWETLPPLSILDMDSRTQSRGRLDYYKYTTTGWDGNFSFIKLEKGDYVIVTRSYFYATCWEEVSVQNKTIQWVNLTLIWLDEESDGDGFVDYEEIFFGTDPNDPQDYPITGEIFNEVTIEMSASFESYLNVSLNVAGEDAFLFRWSMDYLGNYDGIVSSDEQDYWSGYMWDVIAEDDETEGTNIAVDNRNPVSGSFTFIAENAQGPWYNEKPMKLRIGLYYKFEVDSEDTSHTIIIGDFGGYYEEELERYEESIAEDEEVRGGPIPKTRATVDHGEEGSRGESDTPDEGPFFGGYEEDQMPEHFTISISPAWPIIASTIEPSSLRQHFDQGPNRIDLQGDETKELARHTTSIYFTVGSIDSELPGGDVSPSEDSEIYSSTIDSDGDGIFNIEDNDDDNDGFDDMTEILARSDPLDPSSTPDSVDTDGDGIINSMDEDMDNDGIPNDMDEEPYSVDKTSVKMDKEEDSGSLYYWIIGVIIVGVIITVAIFLASRHKRGKGISAPSSPETVTTPTNIYQGQTPPRPIAPYLAPTLMAPAYYDRYPAPGQTGPQYRTPYDPYSGYNAGQVGGQQISRPQWTPGQYQSGYQCPGAYPYQSPMDMNMRDTQPYDNATSNLGQEELQRF